MSRTIDLNLVRLGKGAHNPPTDQHTGTPDMCLMEAAGPASDRGPCGSTGGWASRS